MKRRMWQTGLMVRIAISSAALAASAGCSRPNPSFCAAQPSDVDCRPDAQIGCTSNAGCASPTPVCVVGDNVCRGCSAHVECGSSACLPTGACGDDTSVAYIDPLGSGTQCTKARPCLRVDDAIKTGRPYVKFHGTTDEQVSLNGATATFLADPGARLTSTKNGILLKVDGATQLAIYDLEIGGASGPNAAGISLQAGNTATVDLIQVTIRGNSGLGITASDGTLNVSRSTIVENDGGGLSVTGAVFHIVSNVIGRNGNDTSTAVGGVNLGSGVATASHFEFNTVVGNHANLDPLSSGGVLCSRIRFMAAGNLIFRNTGGGTGDVQTLGSCQYPSSFVSPGASNLDNTPKFANPNTAPFDYHLTAASPTTIIDAAGSCTSTDFDGEKRPIGTACDVGADERKL